MSDIRKENQRSARNCIGDVFRERFADCPNVRVTKGPLPQAMDQGEPARVALLHIDMNNVEAEVGTLARLWDRISPGAHIVFDDYGWVKYRDQQEAIDAWLNPRNYYVTELPTGQGLLVK